jgi:hypothetical protein
LQKSKDYFNKRHFCVYFTAFSCLDLKDLAEKAVIDIIVRPFFDGIFKKIID